MLTDPVESPSQTFLLSLLNGMVDPVFVKDRQHRWVFVNDAFCAFTGYSREAMIGQSGYAFFQKAAAEGLRNQDEQVFATGGATESEEILTTAAGQSFVISTHKNVFYDQTGAAFLSVVIRSIASKSQIEAELQESKQLLRLVIDNIPQLIFWKDRNSVYLGCNQNYAKAAGIGSPDQIVGKTDYDLPWGREATEAYQARDRQIMETDTAVYGILVSRQQAGKQTWAELNKIPLHNADGQVIGILGTYEDITERKQAEETLRQSEATNRALIEAIPDLLIRMAEDGTYLDLAFEGSFKPLAIGATSGKNVSDVMPPNIVEQRLHYTRQALATGKLQLHEQELMINGQLVYEEVRVVPSGDREVLV
ncbi:MAG TPA: PAS domain-containing protein, partial [Coleofasciculaceae cyanobacterium]